MTDKENHEFTIGANARFAARNGKNPFAAINKKNRYQVERLKAYLPSYPMVIVGKLGAGTGSVIMECMTARSNENIIHIKDLTKFVAQGGSSSSIAELMQGGNSVVIEAQCFDQLEQSGIDYSNFKLVTM